MVLLDLRDIEGHGTMLTAALTIPVRVCKGLRALRPERKQRH